MSLSQLSRQLGDNGELEVRALLNILITDVQLSFNISGIMDGDQVIEAAGLVLQEYHYFKPEDFKLCFNNARKGRYGADKLYNRIDVAVIFGWLNAYDDERTVKVEELQQAAAKELRSPSPVRLPSPDPSDYPTADEEAIRTKNLEIWRKRLEANKVGKEKATLGNTDTRSTNPAYILHQRWMRQFDEIWVRQGRPPGRMIKRYGMIKNPFYAPGREGEPKKIHRKLDINAFLDHKQQQLAYVSTRLGQLKIIV